jgi:hypothetical protein
MTSDRAVPGLIVEDPERDERAMSQAMAGDEAILDPDLAICDPHHHLWHMTRSAAESLTHVPVTEYLLPELLHDLGAGHNIVSTAYMEAGAFYRAGIAEAFAPVGETEFANGMAAMSASGRYASRRDEVFDQCAWRWASWRCPKCRSGSAASACSCPVSTFPSAPTRPRTSSRPRGGLISRRRDLRRGSLPVRKQLPGRRPGVRLRDAVECVQAGCGRLHATGQATAIP